MRNAFGVNAKFFHHADRALVIRGIVQQKFGLALGRVSLNRHHDCGRDTDPAAGILEHHCAAVVQSLAPSQLHGDHQGSVPANFAGFHISELQ